MFARYRKIVSQTITATRTSRALKSAGIQFVGGTTTVSAASTCSALEATAFPCGKSSAPRAPKTSNASERTSTVWPRSVTPDSASMTTAPKDSTVISDLNAGIFGHLVTLVSVTKCVKGI